MLFNSIDFAIFLPIVFLLYWFVAHKHLQLQNMLVVAASYLFYGWWDWRFLSLIIFSTVVDYTVGRKLGHEKNKNRRLFLLWVSILVNIGFLGFFKYYNFFVDNFTAAFSLFGQDLQSKSLDIILPVGISFYTFQTLSYTIDVYREKLSPTADFVAFSAFVSFFPQLVAGPIERATHLLPQFNTHRQFDYSKAVDGLRQILWGLFKKVVVADTCAKYANEIFNHSGEYGGSTLVMGALFFTFQIYGDFSGYSDIAIGTSRLFGFDLLQNFRFPYFSRDIAEFWRRWHVSLSTWFRDYLYIPLGGSKGGNWMRIRNTFIIFTVSGFWHGANWTFIVWGALNALYFIPLLLTRSNRKNLDIVAKGKYLPGLKEFFQILSTFVLTLLAWVVFRAEDVAHAISYFATIFSKSLFTLPEVRPRNLLLLLVGFILVEWFGRQGQYAIEILGHSWSRPFRWGVYFVMAMVILLMGGSEQQFIYFQF